MQMCSVNSGFRQMWTDVEVKTIHQKHCQAFQTY